MTVDSRAVHSSRHVPTLGSRHERRGLGLASDMPVEEVPSDPAPLSEPDIRPLGYIAVGFAMLSAVLALTLVLSWLAFLSAVPALVLGFIARTDPATRKMGTAALVVAAIAVVWASWMLVVLFGEDFGY
jgi:hypothetical protein